MDSLETRAFIGILLELKILLRTKLSLFSSLLVLLVVSGVGLGLYVAERRYLIQRIEDSQTETVQTIVQVGREALSTQSALLLSSYLGLLQKSRGLSYAMVVDGEGRVLAHSNVVLVNQKPDDPAAAAALNARALLKQVVPGENDRTIDLALPIYLEGSRVGVARAGYSEAAVTKEVNEALRAARARIAAAAVASLFAGLFGAVLLARYLARPILRLREGARLIGHGELSHRIESISRDELGELAQEFNLMAEKLHELDQLKQDFVSNVTHELRSPLTSLRGYVEFLLRGDAGPVNEEQADNLIVIKNNAARLAKFIDNLLDVAKIEAYKVELHPEAVSMPGIAKEMAVLFRPQAEEKAITFAQDVPADVPAVWADADKLAEILINLLSNAFKFTPQEGRVTLAAREEGENVHITVKDTGVGIPAESLDKVFNKFEQVKPTEGLVRKTKGTGLGLTIVKGFIEAHKGRVWMESREGAGTTVHVTLPKAAAPEPEPDEDELFTNSDGNPSIS